MCVKARGVWELSVLSSRFYVNLELLEKNKVIKKEVTLADL